MAQTVGELVYKVTGDIDNLTKGLDQSNTKAQQLAKNLDKTAEGVKNTSTASSGLSRILAGIAGFLSAGAIAGFLKSSVDAFNEQQIANSKLANALSNVKGARDEDYQALLRQADALQKVTVFSDENIINSQALLATFQLTGGAIQQLTPRILDMASAVADLSGGQVDLQGATIAVGKAMTSGIGILSRYGVTFTPAQEKAFELADETQKLAILTEVLDGNFKDTAETIGKTFAGRLSIAKNQIGEIKEQIGAALLPTLESLLADVVGVTGSIQENGGQLQVWGKYIYQGVNFLIAMGKAAVLVSLYITKFGSDMVGVGQQAYGFVKDMASNFTKLGEVGKSVFGALAKAMKGDISGALDNLNKIPEFTFTNFKNALSSTEDRAKLFDIAIKDSFDSVATSLSKALGTNFTAATTDAVKGYKAMGGAATSFAKDSKDSAKATGDDLKGLQQKFEDLKAGATEATIELSETLQKKLQEADDKIKDLKKSLAELQEQFKQGTADENRTIAERIVAEQQAIIELQKRLQEEQGTQNADPKTIASIQAEISARQAGLQSAAKLEQDFATEITEAKRRAALTDFQRDIEDALRKKDQLAKEFADKKAAIEAEIALQEEAKVKATELEAAKQAEIKAILEAATAQFAAYEDAKVKATKKAVQEQIDEYNRLAAAIRKTQGASSVATLPKFATGGYVGAQGGLVHPGEYVIPPHMVAAFSGLVSQLEGIRRNGGVVNNRTVNAPISINAQLGDSLDARALANELGFEVSRF